MQRTTARQWVALAGALLLAAAPVAGQEVGADTAVQGYAPDAPVSGELARQQASPMKVVGAVVLAPRSDADLDRAIQTADRALNRADAELASAAGRRKQAEELTRGKRPPFCGGHPREDVLECRSQHAQPVYRLTLTFERGVAELPA